MKYCLCTVTTISKPCLLRHHSSSLCICLYVTMMPVQRLCLFSSKYYEFIIYLLFIRIYCLLPQNGYSICKVNRHVQFPLLLDLAPYCGVKCKVNICCCTFHELKWTVACFCVSVLRVHRETLFWKQVTAEGQTEILYSLYGIVEHSGTMRSGHYTAYVKVRPSGAYTSSNGLAQGRRGAGTRSKSNSLSFPKLSAHSNVPFRWCRGTERLLVSHQWHERSACERK